MDQHSLGAEGAALIAKLESQVEDTISTAAELASYFARARRETNVSPVFGQALFDHTAQLMSLTVQARGVSVQLHHSAEAASRKLRITAGPPNQNKPDAEPQPMLKVVSDDVAA